VYTGRKSPSAHAQVSTHTHTHTRPRASGATSMCVSVVYTVRDDAILCYLCCIYYTRLFCCISMLFVLYILYYTRLFCCVFSRSLLSIYLSTPVRTHTHPSKRKMFIFLHLSFHKTQNKVYLSTPVRTHTHLSKPCFLSTVSFPPPPPPLPARRTPTQVYKAMTPRTEIRRHMQVS
jgi:hypothetical protein